MAVFIPLPVELLPSAEAGLWVDPIPFLTLSTMIKLDT